MASRAVTARRLLLQTKQRNPTRPYHSYDHPSPPPYSSTAETILSASLKHVPQHGFTSTSLKLGARDTSHLPISTNLFPQGPFDLILYWLSSRRLLLKEASLPTTTTTTTTTPSNIDDRIRAILLERLSMNRRASIVSSWPAALAVMAQPKYVPQSLQELGKLADELVFLAGDTSVDSSWYTKRGSLAAVYAAAEVFQTTDSSVDGKDTAKFVESRLAEVTAARSGLEAVGEWVGFQAHGVVNVLRSKGVRI
jgi:ubiquinone biosynthesis protein COQ9